MLHANSFMWCLASAYSTTPPFSDLRHRIILTLVDRSPARRANVHATIYISVVRAIIECRKYLPTTECVLFLPPLSYPSLVVGVDESRSSN
ncbi:hypothetical protein F4808DRAFT_431808 [Astrocystis sublimbata]|nr:hypothetical protein F4808DRAFT_431808 [Astrocystis sublimbata]